MITVKTETNGGIMIPGETKTVVKSRKVGYPGKVVVNETISNYNWINSNLYKSQGAASVETKRLSSYYRAYFTFNQSTIANHGFYINVNMEKAGYFDFNFSSNFKGSQGDFLQVIVNGKLQINQKTFRGLDNVESVKDIHVPAGNTTIFIFMMYGGYHDPWIGKKFAIHSFKIQYLDEQRTEQYSETVQGDPTYVNVGPKSYEKYLYNEKAVDLQLQTGKFMFQDTLTLPGVSSCEVQRNIDQESSEATITIANPDGYFSPDYNPHYFPELMGRYKPSPWSYYASGGFHVGVLAENTPIRIYLGYGTREYERPIRVFTGLIDSTDISGGDGTLTIKARDMYKKILNAVLLRRKQYGKEAIYETTGGATTTPAKTVSVSSLSRRQQIYYYAKKAQKEYGLPDEAYYFLLAICWHETVFGTAGQGREPRNMILGYGSFNTNPDYSYGGLEQQMHYGAKRIYEALKSKGYKVKSKSDVSYFWKGGDKGRYQWATDTNWPNAVWSCYLQITKSKSSYAPPNATTGGSSSSSGGTTVDPPWPGKNYKKPMYNNATVKKIQQKLISLGYSIGYGATSNFLVQTDAATRKFQKAKGLKVDGIVGKDTWNKLFEKKLPPPPKPTTKLKQEGEQWLKTAIIADIIDEAGMYGWRRAQDDMDKPDAVIEESYYVEMNEKSGKVVRALPAEKVTHEKKFETVSIKDLQIKTANGWLNPFTEPPTTYYELQHKVSDIINELIKETTYRSYCDRYGTYRLERLNLETPIVAEFRDDENLISLSKNVDYSRARNHIVIYDDMQKSDKNKDYTFASFIDKELLLELKGENRTAVVVVPWAKTNVEKREVAKKLFFDMKRTSRTIQVSIPGNPALDLLDRIRVVDKDSATVASYHIKSIRDSFDVDAGYIQILDLTWAYMDQIVQIPGLIMNTEEPAEPVPPKPPKQECTLWDKKTYKRPMYDNATVKKIQQKLMSLGYSIPDGPTDNYLNQTESAVKKFQKNKGLKVDGIVGEITWNKMFCPSWTPPAPKPVKKVTVSSGLSTRSWRDNWKWNFDTPDVYQGEWENWGHYYGYIFLPSDLRGKLKGKKIKKVRLYLNRYRKQGYYSSQKPTFYTSTKSSASGSPQINSGSGWKSNVGWAVGDAKWVDLPISYGEAIRDGKAKSIAIYTSGRSPYICFKGGNGVKFEIETY